MAKRCPRRFAPCGLAHHVPLSPFSFVLRPSCFVLAQRAAAFEMAGRVVRASPAADSRRSSPRRRAGRLGLFALGTPSAGAARRRVPPRHFKPKPAGLRGAGSARLPRSGARSPRGRPWLRRRVRHPLRGASLGGSAALRPPSRCIRAWGAGPRRLAPSAPRPAPPLASSPPREGGVIPQFHNPTIP